MNTFAKSPRLEVVDSLRGFALMAIVILHCIEHYNLFANIEWQPEWLDSLDSRLIDVIWFLFAGKAYATFSLLFGFSFFIQMRNARSRGCDFRLRFAWRLLLLACFAQLHALFYNGDILLFYAVCGLILIPASSWTDRTVLIVACVLICQPVDWIHIAVAANDPTYVDFNSRFAQFASQAEQIGMHGNLWQTLRDNIGNGQLYSNLWQIEAGRICQTPALFLFGMWLGRRSFFVRSSASQCFWRRVLVVAVPSAVVLWYVKSILCSMHPTPTWDAHIGIATGLPLNFAIMAVLVAAFVLLWFGVTDGYRFQRMSIPFGRMSLTNYIAQSVIGVVIFYNFGLGLYRWCGATLSALIALAVIAILLAFSRMWLRSHRQGPLEAIWKRLTWIKF